MNTIQPPGSSATPPESSSIPSGPARAASLHQAATTAGSAGSAGAGATAQAAPDDRASLQSMPALGDTSTPFDAAAVNRLRVRIASGQYVVDAHATAAAMLSQLLDFRGIG